MVHRLVVFEKPTIAHAVESDEHRLAEDPRVDRAIDRAHEIVDVDEHVGGARASDVRQHAARGEAKQRQHRAIVRPVDDGGPQDRPVEAVHGANHVLALELAAAVRRQRRGRIVLDARRVARGWSAGRETRNLDERDSRAARRVGDDARAFDVRVEERPVAGR